MLSYQHLYHAGNLADVHKHALLAWILDYMTQKEKPITYIETHSGRGLYDLMSDPSLKTGEAAQGIMRVEAWFSPAHPYRRAVTQTRAERGENAYPGSPLIAGHLLRPSDHLHLCELHPQEYQALTYATAPFGAHVYQEDGLAKALSLCPPTPRRGLLLIDPSYEVKTEYDTLPKIIGHLVRKWNVGVIALWYPILTPQVPRSPLSAHSAMIRALKAAHPEALFHEVAFPPSRAGHRMVGSGMMVINPPFGLLEQTKTLSAHFSSYSQTAPITKI